MSLMKLPPEAITKIFSYLVDDDPELSFHDDRKLRLLLCTLARACSRLLGPATDVLYSHVAFVFDGSNSSPVTRRMHLLSTRLRENPLLVNRIRRSNITWHNSSRRTRNDKKACNEFLRILRKSKSLVKLGLRINAKDSPTLLRHFTSRGFIAVRELEVEIDDEGENTFLPAEHIAKQLELPKLETLALQAPVGKFVWGTVEGEALRPPLPHFKEFFMGWSRPVSTDVLAAVLPRTPNLEHLQLLLPGRAELVAREFNSDYSTMGYNLMKPLRPRRLSALLAPVAKSLTHLQLEATNVTFPWHDYTRIDLSAFHSLRHLTISSWLLFGGGGSAATSYCGSQSMWRFLPRRLVDLEICFDGRQGILWSIDEMREQPSVFEHMHWVHRHCASYVKWLTELLAEVAIGKETQGIRGSSRDDNATITLNSVSVVEGDVIDNDRNWKIVKWNAMTDHLKDLARTAGAELDMQLRVPRYFESNECEVIYEAWEAIDDDFLFADGAELEDSEDE